MSGGSLAFAASKVMRERVGQHFPTGRTLAAMLTQISRGMAADGILETGGADGLSEAAIVLLPQFSIREYEGRESVNRVQWDGDAGRSARIITAGQTATYTWTVDDSTLDTLTGTITVDFTGLDPVITGEMPPMIGLSEPSKNTRMRDIINAHRNAPPGEVHLITGWNSTDISRHLRTISKRGTEQTHHLANLLLPFTRDATDAASYRVQAEITGAGDEYASHIVDKIERDRIADQIILGDSANDSITIRLIRRVASTDITVRRSLMNVMGTAIWSAAETVVRQHIGDPHLGRIIRRIHRSLQALGPTEEITPERVLAAYREKHPEARLGIGRVTDALSAGASIHAQAMPIMVTNV